MRRVSSMREPGRTALRRRNHAFPRTPITRCAADGLGLILLGQPPEPPWLPGLPTPSWYGASKALQPSSIDSFRASPPDRTNTMVGRGKSSTVGPVLEDHLDKKNQAVPNSPCRDPMSHRKEGWSGRTDQPNVRGAGHEILSPSTARNARPSRHGRRFPVEMIAPPPTTRTAPRDAAPQPAKRFLHPSS